MKSFLRVALGLAVLALGWWLCSPALSDGPHDAAPEKKFEDFDKLVKGAREFEGLFKLYQKDENLYAEIRQDQLERPLMCPIAIAKGGGFGVVGGSTLNSDEQWVLIFKRVGDKIHLIRRNVHFKAKAGSPLATALETSY